MYYKLNKEDSKKIWEEFKKAEKKPTDDFVKLQTKFLTDFKAKTLIENRWSLGTKITGFIPLDQENIPKWVKTETFYEEGKEETIIYPKLNFKKGKELSARLEELTAATNKIPNFQVEIPIKLGLEGGDFWVNDGAGSGHMVKEIVRIGYMKGQLVMEIPDVHKEHYDINEDLIKIEKSEFIQITEE